MRVGEQILVMKEPVWAPALPDSQSVQDTLGNEQRWGKKKNHNGDKNPISPVVNEREEISECEQGKADWT